MMELLQLLKTLSDQDSRADTQAQIETLRDAIVILDFKITVAWWILFAMICATLALVVYVASKLEKRLKKVESNIHRWTKPTEPDFKYEDERKSREKFEKEVLLNDVSGITGKKSSLDEFLKQG